MQERIELPFHFVILCYMEKYYSIHSKMPTTYSMVRVFNQKRNDDIYQRLQLLVKRGYLRKNPGYRIGTKDDAYWFGSERIDCGMIGDEGYCRYLNSLFDTRWKKEEEAPEFNEYGTTWVGFE